jgi:ABC-2 type transport system ATP-binding protein
MTVPGIELTHLTKRYGNLVAVDGLDLAIEPGDVFGLLGPNGAGKTTTLLMLATLVSPTGGSATVNGFDIVKQRAQVRKSIGIVFQDPSCDDTLTGYENLKLHGMLYSMPVALREQRISEVLQLVELTDRKNDLVKHYSGGMRRRLELGRGLMHRPKVLLLDEPTLGLDPQSREHIWRYIQRLAREEKMSIVITTHYMEEVEMLCNRLAIIDNGKIAALGTPMKLKEVIGGDVVLIVSKDADMDRLKALPFVKAGSNDGMQISLTVDNAREHLAEILRDAGAVQAVEVRSPTLNDVFLHYTGREIRPASPEGGWGERSMHFQSR